MSSILKVIWITVRSFLFSIVLGPEVRVILPIAFYCRDVLSFLTSVPFCIFKSYVKLWFDELCSSLLCFVGMVFDIIEYLGRKTVQVQKKKKKEVDVKKMDADV